MRSAAEGEELGAVVTLLQDRISEVEAQWAERRIPDDAGAGRHADGGAVGVLHAALANEAALYGVDRAVDFAGRGELGFALVAPHRSGIDEYRAAEAGVLGQE